MPFNFGSFDFIIVKGLPIQFGRKTFTGFEIADLESLTSPKILFFTQSKKQKTATSTFKICNFKTSNCFATKLKWQALDI